MAGFTGGSGGLPPAANTITANRLVRSNSNGDLDDSGYSDDGNNVYIPAGKPIVSLVSGFGVTGSEVVTDILRAGADEVSDGTSANSAGLSSCNAYSSSNAIGIDVNTVIAASPTRITNTRFLPNGGQRLKNVSVNPTGETGFGFIYPGIDGKWYIIEGTGSAERIGGQKLAYEANERTASFTAVEGYVYRINLSGASADFLITLPSSLVVGSRMVFIISTPHASETYKLTWSGNGNNINGSGWSTTPIQISALGDIVIVQGIGGAVGYSATKTEVPT